MKVVNTVEFESTTKKGITLVDFSAEWCGPCKMIAPVLEQLSTELEGKVNIIKVDVDVEQQLARQCVHNRNTYTVQTTGNFIAVIIKFTTRMQDGQNYLSSRDTFFRVNIGWNTTSIIRNTHRFIFMNRD